MNGLSFGPRPDISLRWTPRAFSTSVKVLTRVPSAAVRCWTVGRRRARKSLAGPECLSQDVDSGHTM